MARPLRPYSTPPPPLEDNGHQNLWKYHVKVCRYFYLLFLKNRAILVQKLWGEKSCQNLFSAILRLKKNLKKVPMAIKLEGGVRP